MMFLGYLKGMFAPSFLFVVIIAQLCSYCFCYFDCVFVLSGWRANQSILSYCYSRMHDRETSSIKLSTRLSITNACK